MSDDRIQQFADADENKLRREIQRKERSFNFALRCRGNRDSFKANISLKRHEMFQIITRDIRNNFFSLDNYTREGCISKILFFEAYASRG